VVCAQSMGPVNCVWVLCVGGCCVLCDGVCVDADARCETEKVCCVVDCWEYSFPWQVRISLMCVCVHRVSFAALQGPVPYIKHLMSPARLPFTAAYFGSLGLTLYFSVEA